MGQKKLTMGFNGGEVTPEFWGQIADAKFQAGLAQARNVIVLPHGPVQNRPGFAYCAAVKTPARRTRVIPFVYSTTQTFALEFGHGYIRFFTQGAALLTGTPTAYSNVAAYTPGDVVGVGTAGYYCTAACSGKSPPDANYWALLSGQIYEVPSPYQEADLFDLKFVQSADVLTIVHPNYPAAELRRQGALKWVLATINFATSLQPPGTVSCTPTLAASPSNLRAYKYAVTSLNAAQTEESAISAASTGAGVLISAVTQANPAVFTTGVAHGLTVGDSVNLAGVIMLPGTILDGAYTVNTAPTSTTFTLKQGTTVLDTSAMGVYTYNGVVQPQSVQNNLLQTGAYNTITWASTGAALYNVYAYSNGLWGFIGQTPNLTFRDDNITPNLGVTPPIQDTALSQAGYYPGAVSYFEQRRVFAGSLNEPQTLRMTRTGTESNLTYSLPSKDTDRISVRVAAREANTIRHLVPITNLLLLTGAAEWRVTSVNSDAITPTSIDIKAQSYIGANNVQPVIVNNNVIYAAARGGHLREMAYSFQFNGYVTGDLSLRAPHLFNGMQIVDMALAKTPQPVVWCVSSSGKLLGLTYVPEQQVGAWHQHDTAGLFESVCVVPEGDEDAVYCVVRRQINGAWGRYVERMRARPYFDQPGVAQSSAFFVDCGATYSGAPATTISGLTWLEGATVSVLGDGAVFPQKVVQGGQITLEAACSVVHVGLPYTSDVRTLPISAQIDAALGQGRPKDVSRVWLRLVSSAGVWVGPSLDRLVQIKQRTTEPLGTPPVLITDERDIVPEPSWQQNGQIYVQQTDPLPFTLASLTVDAAFGG